MPVLLHHGIGFPGLPLAKRVERASFEDLLVVVPTKRRLRHLFREVLRAAPGRAFPSLPFHTLESLAEAIYAALPTSRRVLRGPILTLLFDQAVRSRVDALRYFTPKRADGQLFRGTFDRIIDVINNLKESGVYPDLLEEELSSAELDEQRKLADVATIYKAYDEGLDAIAATDAAGLYKWLASGCTQSQFEGAFRSLYPGVRAVSLAGFDEFTEPEIGLLRKLSVLPELSVSLLFDFLPGNSGLFGHLEENYRKFHELGFRDAGQLQGEAAALHSFGGAVRPPSVRKAIDHMAQYLFHEAPPTRPLDLTSHVTLVNADSRGHEVEIICKLIKQLASGRPDRGLNGICVAMYRPQLYTDLFREQFPKFGVPANITDRYLLHRSPVVIAILALLQMPLNGFRREDILRGVRTPYLSFGEMPSPVSVGTLARISQRLRIVAGIGSWTGKIDRRLAELRREDRQPGADDEASRRAAETAELGKAREDIAWLEQLLRPLAGANTPAEFKRLLLEMLARLKVQENLLVPADASLPELVEKDVRAYAKFLEVLDTTVDLLRYQEGDRTTHPLAFYLDQLKVAVAQERYNVREQFGLGVLVTSIEETRGLPMEIMIIAGLVDGEFPPVYQPEIFLSANRQRKRVEWHTWQSRYLFYQAATNWSEHLYLTCPRKDGDLELVRSPFVDALEKIATLEDWETREQMPVFNHLSSEEEAVRWYGLHDPGQLNEDELPSRLRARLVAVRRSIAVERSRVERHGLPEFEGYLFDALPGRYREALAALGGRTYSVSQLETYGQCPFKYFSQRLLQLNVIDDLREELTPLEKGSILHEALFEFYTDRRNRKLGPISRCSDGEFEDAVRDLVRITAAKLAAVDIPDPFWGAEQELILGRGETGGMLRAFLEAERRRTDSATPSYFEVGFGGGPGPRRETDRVLSTDEPVTAGGVRLRGKVDRVDTGEGFFTIIDYKTGFLIPTLEDIRRGWSLQLPVYLYAMEKMLSAATGRSLAPAAGLYYRLRDPVELKIGLADGRFGTTAFENKRTVRILEEDTGLRAEIENSIRTINNFVDDICRGKFPLTSPENVDRVCAYCEFKTVCRIQTVRHVRPKETEAP